jgi:DNA ligase 1
MDIRNFFGKAKDPKSSPTPTKAKAQKTEQEPKKEKQEKETTSDQSTVEEIVLQTDREMEQKKEVVENGKCTEIPLPSQHPIPSDLNAIINWEIGEPVPYAAVAAAFDKIAATSSRLEKESILCKLYRSVVVTTPQDLECVVYLTSNVVFPAYEGLELGIGDALLVKAVVDSTGRNRAAVQAAYKADGDLGTVACQSRSSQSTLAFGAKPKPLTARFVLEQLRAITRISGTKSMDRKVGIIKKMMVSCQGDEAKYIVRALQGKLRIGQKFVTNLLDLLLTSSPLL